MKHTPGPWIIADGDRDVCIIAVGSTIAAMALPANTAHQSREVFPERMAVVDANARLIVNAVNSHADLLEALKAMLTTALKCDDMAWANAVDRAETSRPCDMAAAAIAKAEGRP